MNLFLILNSLILNSLEVSSKKEVNELSNDDYDKQLKKFLLADKSKIKQWEKMRTEYWMNSPKNSSLPIPEEAMAYYSMITIRNWGVRGYRWGNEYIAKNVLDYRPVPGQQKGCVDLNKTTGGFVWALQ